MIENYDGVVENVGFRSTRIRLLTGHLVTIPNEKVVSSGLENIGRRPNIRWLTNIGITYDTPPEKIERAVEIIRDILADHEGEHPDFPPRVYFNGFNDWSLIMVGMVGDPDRLKQTRHSHFFFLKNISITMATVIITAQKTK